MKNNLTLFVKMLSRALWQDELLSSPGNLALKTCVQPSAIAVIYFSDQQEILPF